MIRAVFIDWYGTLSVSRFWDQWSVPGHPRARDFEAIQQVWHQADTKEIVSAWCRGKYSAEEFVLHIADRIDLPYDDLMREHIEGCSTWEFVDPGIPQLVRDLRESNTLVAIATDNVDSFDRWVRGAMGLDRLFDGVLNSWDLHRLKGDGGFFSAFLSEHDLAASDCMLIDDSRYESESLAGVRQVVVPFGVGPCQALQDILAHTNKMAPR